MFQSVEQFDASRHKRSNFQSGTFNVDNFLKLNAKKLNAAHAAAIFVLADDTNHIIGFYSLCAITIDASELNSAKGSNLFGRFNAVPATLLSMIGVDKQWQGKGIGKMLLADALRRSLAATKQVGSFCVVLDVLQDADATANAKRLSLYLSFGFQRCDTEKGVRLFLSMKDIKASALT